MHQTSRRNFSFLLITLAGAALTLAQVGCDSDRLADLTNLEPVPQQATARQSPNPQSTNQPNHTNPAGPTNTTAKPQIIIGSFNIQMFGKTKMGRPPVVSALVDITRRFDILAIQELRDKDQRVIPEFLSHINKNGAAYAAAVGPRQGYVVAGQTTRYFEQTVFLYDRVRGIATNSC